MSDPVRVEPMDDHNRQLVDRTHPPDWTNPTPDGRYNLVVVGAGTAGLVAAAGAAAVGAKVALVERYLFGGDCLNYGCVPSKSLIASADLAGRIRRASEYGLTVEGAPGVDFAEVMRRMRGIRTQISAHDAAERFREMGIDVYLGDAAFTGPDHLRVGEAELTFARACIATGTRPYVPEIPGLADAGFLTNETIFTLTEPPEHLAVVGAGPIGCEMAQAFARLGTQVTLMERTHQILPREDPDAAALLAEAMRRDGVEVLLRTELERVEPAANGQKTLQVRSRDEPRTLEADAILVGAGRAPKIEGLGLEAAGVDFDPRRGVRVDDRLRTANRRIYAAGDVALGLRFTHTADASARIVVQNALFFGRKRFSRLTIPWCTYTAPEIAHTGLYEQDAEDRGIPVDTFQESFGAVDRALTEGQENGLIKVHVRCGRDEIVGATIVAHNAGDMISEITLAMEAGVGLGKISEVIHPYPTQAEAIKKIADAYNRTRLTPRVAALLGWICRLRR